MEYAGVFGKQRVHIRNLLPRARTTAARGGYLRRVELRHDGDLSGVLYLPLEAFAAVKDGAACTVTVNPSEPEPESEAAAQPAAAPKVERKAAAKRRRKS